MTQVSLFPHCFSSHTCEYKQKSLLNTISYIYSMRYWAHGKINYFSFHNIHKAKMKYKFEKLSEERY